MKRIGQSAGKISMKNNEYMAYITGVYMSDGSLSIHTRGYMFKLSSIDMDYIRYTQKCFQELLGKPGNIWNQKKIPKGRVNPHTGKIIQQKHSINTYTVYSKEIFEKLKSETNNKEQIPQWIKDSNLKTKIEFLSGIIDGDGWIVYNISGSGRGMNWQIGLSGRENALKDVSKICNVIGIKNWGPTKIKASKSTYRLYFNTLDMLKYKFNFKIKRKNDKLEFIRKILNDYMLVSKTKPKRIKEALGLE